MAPAPSRQSELRTTAEDLARDAYQGGNFTEAVIQQVLSLINVPSSTTRKNVMPDNATCVRGMLLGLYVYGDKIEISSSVAKFPHTTRLLAAYAQQRRPGFRFTSIQVNVNYASRPHTDKNNMGSSMITTLGKFTGGELFVHDQNGDVSHTLAEDVGNDPRYKKGTRVRGYNVQCCNRWFEFDGTKLHFTQPYKGNRCSLVFFTCARYPEAKPEVRMDLGDAGFNFLWSVPHKFLGDAVMQGEQTKNKDKGQELSAFRQAVWALLDVNSNQVGGGGVEKYHVHSDKVRKALKKIPNPQRAQAEVLLDAAADKENFQAKTPGSWRKFLPKVLEIAGEGKEEVAEARKKANPKGLNMQVVYAATARAKRIRIML